MSRRWVSLFIRLFSMLAALSTRAVQSVPMTTLEVAILVPRLELDLPVLVASLSPVFELPLSQVLE